MPSQGFYEILVHVKNILYRQTFQPLRNNEKEDFYYSRKQIGASEDSIYNANHFLLNKFACEPQALYRANLDKGKVLHVGKNNIKHQYSMGGNPLDNVSEEKDLGITVTESFKSSKQCNIAAAEANRNKEIEIV